MNSSSTLDYLAPFSNLTETVFTAAAAEFEAVLEAAAAAAAATMSSSSSSSTTRAPASAPPPTVPTYTIAISLAIYLVILLVGFFGNAIVIFVVACNKSLQHNTNYCLVNLSVADLLLIVVCMPSAIVDLFAKEVWYFGYIMCKIIPWLEYTIAHASVLTIVAISVERTFAITSPLLAKQVFTSRRLCLVVVAIWLVSTVSSVPFMLSALFIQAHHRTLGRTVNICIMSTKEPWHLAYLFFSLFLFYLLPCLLLFIQYSRIVLTIKKRSLKQQLGAARHNMQPSPVDLEAAVVVAGGDKTAAVSLNTTRSPSIASKFSQRPTGLVAKPAATIEIKLPHIKQKQIIRLLIVMVLLCFICLLPYRIFSLWTATASKQDLSRLGMVAYYNLLIFSRVAFYLNSALNPIFYHIISTKFQDAFKRFFASSSSRRNSSQHATLSNVAAASAVVNSRRRRSTLAMSREKSSNPTPPVSKPPPPQQRLSVLLGAN